MRYNLVDTDHRKNLEALFNQLHTERAAIWGKMNAQQMVEHLITQVQYTNGKMTPFCEVAEEEARLAKQAHVYTDLEIPRNLVLGKIPDQLTYPDLSTAIRQLMTELDDFDKYFSAADTFAIHGGFGSMNYEEWIIWHSKHFTHHLKQFGLIEVDD